MLNREADFILDSRTRVIPNHKSVDEIGMKKRKVPAQQVTPGNDDASHVSSMSNDQKNSQQVAADGVNKCADALKEGFNSIASAFSNGIVQLKPDSIAQDGKMLAMIDALEARIARSAAKELCTKKMQEKLEEYEKKLFQ
uniref:Uncharacterized protein n=1 Tax=Corethron hystrix TaxID=216773 RepID=A0A7S1G1E4_9STRA|mmetsp:Transcript_43151/g.101174  ORF Transcript_43151/g.101174 Transcript_43151/m.101174 type:complete len:140 (+) Transcript_43151:1585-2004(+)